MGKPKLTKVMKVALLPSEIIGTRLVAQVDRQPDAMLVPISEWKRLKHIERMAKGFVKGRENITSLADAVVFDDEWKGGACKWLIDAIVQTGLIPDDDFDTLTPICDQVRLAKGEGEESTVVIFRRTAQGGS